MVVTGHCCPNINDHELFLQLPLFNDDNISSLLLKLLVDFEELCKITDLLAVGELQLALAGSNVIQITVLVATVNTIIILVLLPRLFLLLLLFSLFHPRLLTTIIIHYCYYCCYYCNYYY